MEIQTKFGVVNVDRPQNKITGKLFVSGCLQVLETNLDLHPFSLLYKDPKICKDCKDHNTEWSALDSLAVKNELILHLGKGK